MSEQGNHDYYRRREQQEREAAGAATGASARLIHEELAACYQTRAGVPRAMEDEPRVTHAAV